MIPEALKAAPDRVLVRLDSKKSESSGGIIIPDTAQERPVTGQVLSVGSGVRDDRVQPKSHVLLNDGYAGALIYDKSNVTIVSVVEEEILALLD
jgi:chaperonin GroES